MKTGGGLEYPMEDVLRVKQRRLEKAEEEVQIKKRELAEEEEKLVAAKKQKQKIVDHQNDKINQIRQAFDEGTTSDEIIMMKNYLKVVEEKVAIEEKKVAEQKEKVRQAEDNLEVAREDMRARRNEVDKIDIHKAQWTKITKEEIRIEMEKELNEIGNVLYLKNREKWK